MRTINILNYRKNFSDDELLQVIDTLIDKNEEVEGLTGYLDDDEKLLVVAVLLAQLSDTSILYRIVKRLQKFGYLMRAEVKHKALIQNLPLNHAYTQEEYKKLTTIYYSVIFSYELLRKRYHQMFNRLQELYFHVDGTTITHNIDEVQNFIKRKLVDSSITNLQQLSAEEQEATIKKLISSFARMEYTLGTSAFTEEIKLLELLKLNIAEIPAKNANPYPGIFYGSSNEAYLLFKKFTELNIDPYADFSFIFQQMKEDKLILNLKHSTYIDWLFEHEYLSEKTIRNLRLKTL